MTRLLLCGTDAGGAVNLAHVAVKATEAGIETAVVTSSRCAHLWSTGAGEVSIDISRSELARRLDADPPEAVICGTTSFPAIEQTILAEAERRGVRRVVFVDERYGYRERFGATWPEAIALLDQDAVREAVAAGLPSARCHATGSPSLAALVAQGSRYQEAPPAWPECVDSNAPYVTFLSERIAADYGTSVETPGPLGPYLGFTEDQVRSDLLATLESFHSDVMLVEKVHPGANAQPVSARGLYVRHVVTRTADLPSLLWHSRFVVGMRSMALLESALLGVPALSYQPSLGVEQRCTAVRLGVVPFVSTSQALGDWCRLALGREDRQPPGAWEFARPDAAERVLDLAVGETAPQMPAQT
ncbi:MAG: hypothetical protein AB7K63_07180 [Vicinamibacterales bacterium]